MFRSKEGFSGYHEVNTILRFFYRCNDAINTAKSSIGNVISKITPKSNGDKCNHHYQCKDKCICGLANENKKSNNDEKQCLCVPKSE